MRYAKGERGALGPLKYDIVAWTRGKVLELGVGPFKVWPHFVGVRKRTDDTLPPSVAPDFAVDELHDLDSFEDGAFDAVVLNGVDLTEPIRDQARRLLRDGGKLIHVEGGELRVLVRSFIGLSALAETKPDGPTACVVRYGAIGDSVQTAAVLRKLREQGYHVTFLCQPTGEVLLRHDPNVNRFLVEDEDQVPNDELFVYFAHLAKKYDRFVNLCECVEGQLLFDHLRIPFYYPKELRHEIANHNYLERMCKIAGVNPGGPQHVFYDTPEDRVAGDALIAEIDKATNPDWVMGAKWRRPFVVMWVMSGSGVHKTYPHQDAVIARLLHEVPHAHVITVGDEASRILEVGWEKEPRVHMRSGELAIRETLSLAKRVDLVIGPETGVLNSVAFETNHKIVFLSHSTRENLTRDWTNTEALEPEGTECYPCHQLHKGWKHCRKHESGTAQCQWDISAEQTWRAVQRAYTAVGTVRQLLEAA